jgi:predicted alpha/beta-hydrolase family hydrolase
MSEREPGERYLHDGPPDAAAIVVLTHGAGAPMDAPSLTTIARGLGERGIHVVRFELPYMRRRREGGGRGGRPDPPAVLEAAWLEAIEQLGGGPRLVIGGRSMGGRIASYVADRAGARGLVCLGYPFHPPGQPAKLRTAHLRDLRTPTLVVQGTRDPFGTPEDVAGYELSPAIELVWIEGGDHGFKPLARSGRTERDTLAEAAARVADFVLALPGAR